jgi:hypothetical protein
MVWGVSGLMRERPEVRVRVSWGRDWPTPVGRLLFLKAEEQPF